MKRTSFFDLFPPPTFLAMPSIGLSLEADALRVVSFEKKHHRPMLKFVDEFKLEPGTVSSGEILKPDKLVAVLKDIRSKYKVRFARISLPEEKAYVYETVVPLPEDGSVADAIEFSLDQNIPLGASEATFDYVVVEGPFENEGVLSVRAIVSAYHVEIAQKLVELFGQAGIAPLSFVPESHALANSVVPTGDPKTVLLVHFLKDKTVISIVSGGLVRFSTTVSGDLQNIEKILGEHEGEKISESLELLSVRDEIKKVYSYWATKQGIKSHKGPQGIKSVVVTGHLSSMTDISDYLGRHLGVPIILGNVWQNAFSLNDYIPELEFEDSLRFASAVGVALSR